MIAPPQCLVDNRLMLQWYEAVRMHMEAVEIQVKRLREMHRDHCSMCRARMAYFKAMMEKV
jgi:hypothetical protein